jgi:uncharacterized protein DUF2735
MDESYPASAKIYQFPIRHRAVRDKRRQGEARISNDRFCLRAGEAVVDDNWYHEAAIQAAMQDAKPPREH